MLNKCDFKVEQGACMIIAPEDRDVLPGRMLRQMAANLEKHFQLLEFSCVQGYKAVDEMEDVVGAIELKSGFFKRMFGNRDICVFQKLHPSFYEEDFVQLSDEEKEAFRANLPEGEELVEADYTVSIPSYFFMCVTGDDIRKLMDVLNHLKLNTFDEVRNAVAMLCEATISIFDEIEILAEYAGESFPKLIAEGLDEWLKPPEQVEYLDI